MKSKSKMASLLIKSLGLLKVSNKTLKFKKKPLRENTMFNLNEILNKWCESFTNDYTGGKMRSDRGEHIELFVRNTINAIGKDLNINLIAKQGNTDKKDLVVNDSLKKQHQVDVHIYLDEKFIAVVECKAYLDACYYTRACDDFILFKKFGYNVKNYIFTLENSIDSDTKIFTDHITDSICNNVFFILDGKRSSSKPIYNPYFKKMINQQNLNNFIDTIYALKEII